MLLQMFEVGDVDYSLILRPGTNKVEIRRHLQLAPIDSAPGARSP